MGFSKTAAPVAPAAPAPAAVEATPAQEMAKKIDARNDRMSGEDKKVRGQVAMHAIIAGYEAASRLVLTLSPKPAEARDLLHTLAVEIASKIEVFSFHD